MYKIATLNKISPKGLNLFTPEYQLAAELAGADAAIVRSAALHDAKLPATLLAIARAGAGTNNIPIEKCSERGIVVFNTPGANANAVKELVIAALLIASRDVIGAVDWAREIKKDAPATVEKEKARFVGEEIKGKTLGVIGLGYIGVMVANAAEKLGMKVAGYDPYLSPKTARDLSGGVKIKDTLPALLAECDYVTLHVPANDETKGMFDAKILANMKAKAALLNFSRDAIVDSKALKKALADKKLRLYITDFPTDEMLGVPGAVLIPHLGASTRESEENCAMMAVEQIRDFLELGNIENSVNYPDINAGRNAAAGPRVWVAHKNIPSMLGQITGALAGMHLNIANLVNRGKDAYAVTILDLDDAAPEKQLKAALSFDGIISIRIIK